MARHPFFPRSVLGSVEMPMDGRSVSIGSPIAWKCCGYAMQRHPNRLLEGIDARLVLSVRASILRSKVQTHRTGDRLLVSGRLHFKIAKRISKVAGSIRHLRDTLPRMSDGARLMPATGVPRYSRSRLTGSSHPGFTIGDFWARSLRFQTLVLLLRCHPSCRPQLVARRTGTTKSHLGGASSPRAFSPLGAQADRHFKERNEKKRTDLAHTLADSSKTTAPTNTSRKIFSDVLVAFAESTQPTRTVTAEAASGPENIH